MNLEKNTGIDWMLLQLIKRFKAHNSRLEALEKLTGDRTQFFDIGYSDLIYDCLGVPDNMAESDKSNSSSNSNRIGVRDLLDDELAEADTDTKILRLIAHCRVEAAIARHRGVPR